MKPTVTTGAMRRFREGAAILIVGTVTLAGCVAASVATAQVASAAKGGGPITDLVVERLANLAIINFFALGAVAMTTWNASNKRVRLLAAQAINAKTEALEKHVARVEKLVVELSEHLTNSAEQRVANGELMERILKHMNAVERRHLEEDIAAKLAEKRAEEERHRMELL